MELKNEERFAGKADIYKKFRPTYPQELIDYLYSQIGFNLDSIVADIGSGSGIFSRLLLERGNRVYCVEPNEDMRRTAELDLTEFKNYISVNASAENTSLENVSIDFITVATAFHWSNKGAFKLECKRILKNNGKIVIIFNNIDNEHEVAKKDYEIREKYCVDRKGLGRGFTKNAVNNFFLNNDFEYQTFRNDLIFDKESFIGRNLSTSYAPKEETDPEKYHGLVRELSEFFDEYSSNGVLLFPHFSMSFIGRVLSICIQHGIPAYTAPGGMVHDEFPKL